MRLTCGGTIWTKWPRTARKLQNQRFWGKAVGGDMGVGQASFLGSGVDPPSSPPPTHLLGENLQYKKEFSYKGLLAGNCTFVFDY